MFIPHVRECLFAGLLHSSVATNAPVAETFPKDDRYLGIWFTLGHMTG